MGMGTHLVLCTRHSIFIVNNISVMMFTKMGVPNGEMALFTSLLYLPWTIKPFWSPFVDIIKTKDGGPFPCRF